MKLKQLFGLIFVTTVLTALLPSCQKGGEDSGSEPDTPTVKKENFTRTWNENRQLQSRVLDRTVTYNLLLPDEYLTDRDAVFPVVYLFHGYGDTPASWGPGSFDLPRIAKEAREAGLTGPVIYVMPSGWSSYYVNRYDGRFDYMKMIVEELVPHIDILLRTDASPRGRAVAGYSMGGFGALATAGKNPKLFGTCIALSPSMNTDEQYRYLGAWDSQWGSVFGGSGTIGDARLTAYYKEMCPLHFFADRPASEFADLAIFLDCGDDEERLYAGSGELHSLLRDRGIKHEYRVRNGAHTVAYWRDGLKEGLAFFNAVHEGREYPAVTSPSSVPSQKASIKATTPSCRIFTAPGFKADDRSRIIYAQLDTRSLSVDDLALYFYPILSQKNAALAVVNGDMALDAYKVMAEAESSLGITPDDSRRWIACIGGKPSLTGTLAASGRTFAGIALLDSGIKAGTAAGFYALTGADMGIAHREMFETFCDLRKAEARVEYRVINADDSSEGMRACLAELVDLISLRMPI